MLANKRVLMPAANLEQLERGENLDLYPHPDLDADLLEANGVACARLGPLGAAALA